MMLFFRVGPLALSHLQQVERVFYIMHCALRKTDNLFIHYLEVDCSLLQQVVDLLVVDLQVGNAEGGRGGQLLEDILEGEEDESLCVAIAQHGIGLAGSGLSVHEDSCVTALQELLNHFGTAVRVNFLIGVAIAKDVVTCELVDVVEFDLALLAGWSRDWVVLVEDGAVVAQGVRVGQGGDFLLVLTHTPGLYIFILVDEWA